MNYFVFVPFLTNLIFQKLTINYLDTTANVVVRGIFGTTRPIKIHIDNNASQKKKKISQSKVLSQKKKISPRPIAIGYSPISMKTNI